MNDRELLEDAAKAAGKTKARYVEFWNAMADPAKEGDGFDRLTCWNPITDDGDAFRLAVKLGLSLLPYPVYREDSRHSVVVKQRRSGDTLRELNPTEALELYGEDPYAATRRAIVRAAAEIGRSMT